MQESEYKSMRYYAFQKKEYNYKVIIECNIILQIYYIIRRSKSEINIVWIIQKMLISFKRNLASWSGETRNKGATTDFPAPQDKFGPWRRDPLQLKLQDLNMHVKESQKATQ